MTNLTEATKKLNDIRIDMNAKVHADFTSLPMSVTITSGNGDGDIEFLMDEKGVLSINSAWTLTEAEFNKLKKMAQNFMIAYLLEYFVYMKVKEQPPEQTYTFA